MKFVYPDNPDDGTWLLCKQLISWELAFECSNRNRTLKHKLLNAKNILSLHFFETDIGYITSVSFQTGTINKDILCVLLSGKRRIET